MTAKCGHSKAINSHHTGDRCDPVLQRRQPELREIGNLSQGSRARRRGCALLWIPLSSSLHHPAIPSTRLRTGCRHVGRPTYLSDGLCFQGVHGRAGENVVYG